MLSAAACRALAREDELTGVDLRVLFLLCARLDHENFMRVAQTEIAEALGKRAEHITRSIRKLEERKIILPGPRVGRSLVWRLNPDYGTTL